MAVRRVEELTEDHVDDLHGLKRNEWWTDTRAREERPRMLAKSDELVAFEDADSTALVAFARVLTDYTDKALIFDVGVAESHGGDGNGSRLMEHLLDHPRLVDVADFDSTVSKGWSDSSSDGDTRTTSETSG